VQRVSSSLMFFIKRTIFDRWNYKYTMFSGIQKVQIPEDLEEHTENIKNFQEKLLSSIFQRFTVNKERGEQNLDSNGRPARFFSTNVMNDETYILATLLDPRIKQVPFQGGKLF